VLDGAISHAAAQDPRIQQALADRSGEVRRGAERDAPPARVSRPGARPYLGLRRYVRETIAKATEARASALEKGAKPEQLGKLMAIEELATDPRWAELDASYTPPDADLPGARLDGADLSRGRLRGSRCAGALFSGANLTKASFRGRRARRRSALRREG
jgi:hypothetical protein